MRTGPRWGWRSWMSFQAMPASSDYAPYHAARGELLKRLGRAAEAADALRRALTCPINGAERAHLSAELTAVATQPRRLGGSELLVVTGSGLAHLDRGPLGRGTLVCEAQRLGARVAVDEEETADEFLGLGEGSVEKLPFATAVSQSAPPRS